MWSHLCVNLCQIRVCASIFWENSCWTEEELMFIYSLYKVVYILLDKFPFDLIVLSIYIFLYILRRRFVIHIFLAPFSITTMEYVFLIYLNFYYLFLTVRMTDPKQENASRISVPWIITVYNQSTVSRSSQPTLTVQLLLIFKSWNRKSIPAMPAVRADPIKSIFRRWSKSKRSMEKSNQRISEWWKSTLHCIERNG